ncbi:MAG: DNA mismatch repair endonuclease MutL [Myxococcales bacterium]|nr:DNA mismatch repair endonuclease MutL [Myxococcales bacterium]
MSEVEVSGVRILEERVIDQIAAGEVVERPASVVKELLENALDAGASHVDVTLRDGGKTLIQVADDGRGMSQQDALLCIERHATSKIWTMGDLQQVGTFGFRGEALPSIAAVSRFELITCVAGAEEGTRVRLEGGTLTDVREVGAAKGTVVRARSLFFNLPARRAFLRATSTELGHCVQAVVRAALVRPDVGVSLTHGGRRLVDAPICAEDAAAGPLVERAAALLGSDARKLVAVEASDGGLQLRGVASPPGVDRANRNGSVYVYVNGRWVRDMVLRRAIAEAYRDRVPRGRHPLVVLDVRLPGSGVDVNVHPAKAEVRFADPAAVGRFVASQLRAAVSGISVPQPVDASMPGLPFAPDDELPPSPPPRGFLAAVEALPEAGGSTQPVPVPQPVPVVAEPSARDASVAPPQEEGDGRVAVLGVIGGRYAVGDRGGAVWVLDAGRLGRRLAASRAEGPGKRLLVPVVIRLSPAEVQAAEAHTESLAELGLDLARFSPTELAVRAIPGALADADPVALAQVALSALSKGADVREAWGQRLSPAAVSGDPIEVRTWLAWAEEAGVPVAVAQIDPADLVKAR